MSELYSAKNFEHLPTQEVGRETLIRCLNLSQVATQFARVERIPRYPDGERENDAEHSFMLGLVAPELASCLRPDLDRGLIAQFALVHDLIEVKTGDIATFLFSEADQNQKETIEQRALEELVSELPPYTREILLRYESQEDEEARFVRYVDKLLPIVLDIIGQGERVMREDYAIDSLAELQRCHRELHTRLVAKFGAEFPELDLAHEMLCELFETM